MDKREATIIAKRYIDLVRKKYPLKKALLFGSYAKETNHPDSDIDIALIFEHVDDIIDMQIELMYLRNDDDLLIEPHPFAESDFNFSNPQASEILKNGIELASYLLPLDKSSLTTV